jgi:hypothetical protein
MLKGKLRVDAIALKGGRLTSKVHCYGRVFTAA